MIVIVIVLKSVCYQIFRSCKKKMAELTTLKQLCLDSLKDISVSPCIIGDRCTSCPSCTCKYVLTTALGRRQTIEQGGGFPIQRILHKGLVQQTSVLLTLFLTRKYLQQWYVLVCSPRDYCPVQKSSANLQPD